MAKKITVKKKPPPKPKPKSSGNKKLDKAFGKALKKPK